MQQYYKEQRPSSDRVHRYKKMGNTIFEILDGSPIPQKWVFFFIRILVIRGKAYTRQITLGDRDVISDDKPDRTMTECTDYNFGNGDPTRKTELDSIPPQEEDKDTETIPLLSKSCSDLDNCLEKTQILPMFFFHTFASKLATCTHLNLALIPKIIARKQLKKVDQYLYTIHRIWFGTTVLTFGVKKVVLKWQAKWTHDPAPEAFIQDFPTVELLHSPGCAANLRDLPTAEIVFRLVQYVANERVYQALIVIHTDLTAIPDNSARICSKQSELQGWDRITNEDSETGFTYVCPITKEIIQRLELATKYAGFDFQLNKFPIRTGNLNKEMPTKDVTEEIDIKLKYFIDKGILERI